jgi:hypothetical protein
MWIGGGLAASTVGIAMRRGPREDLPALLAVQVRLHARLILPGCVLAVISGILLTLRLYGSASSVDGFPLPLMVMQGAGLLAAILVLVLAFPTINRLSRLDPNGEYGPLFQALSKKMAITGALTGMLAMAALIGGVLLR